MVLPNRDERDCFLERCVLSSSGLRFIHSGDEEDLGGWAGDDTIAFVLQAVGHFAGMLRERGVHSVWLGHDSRPTGPQLMGFAAYLLRAEGFEIKAMGLGPIPEVMAATHSHADGGFCYFTASHNPVGHNGLKLGFGDGAVLGRESAAQLIDKLKKGWADDTVSEYWLGKAKVGVGLGLPNWEENLLNAKRQSRNTYRSFAFSTVDGEGGELLKCCSESWNHGTPWLLVDMNGSSRIKSIDLELFREMGFQMEVIGAEPGVFQHAIVPEGDSLEPLREAVQSKVDEGESVLFGLVPDCDGDRGNLILVVDGVARPLKAQETFALCALAEYSRRTFLGGEAKPLALAANGPSSLRLEQVLKPHAVVVERAEVGEANVLALASSLRERGYEVPLSGEGSNGGNILYPSTVRDPLMTVLGLLKFVCQPLRDGKSAAELLLGDQAPPAKSDILSAVLKSLPSFFTTDAFEGDALMPVPSIEHEVLKSNYEQLLLNHFEEDYSFWDRLGVAKLRFVSNEGTQNILGPGGRPAPGRGGLQVFCEDGQGAALGFLWMRGSGTEPVFRVVVDWGGSEEEYEALLKLHRQLISESAEV
jgi:phosphoglucomutase